MSDQGIPQATGTELTRFNALKHGILSRYVVLPWEDADAYRRLVEALCTEHQPQGPTEEHLVEELAGILWRKGRLRLAEAAAHRRGLDKAAEPFRNTARAATVHEATIQQTDGVREAISASAEKTNAELAEIDEDEAMTRRALETLWSAEEGAYERAIAELRSDTRKWWQSVLATDPADRDESERDLESGIDGLRRFIEELVLPLLARHRCELRQRPLVREQAYGESLDPDRLDRLARYEAHLDRKLERMLSMLIKLKDLRGTLVEP